MRRRGRGGEMQPPPPMRRRFSEPFMWIILGAVLVFVSGMTAGVLSVILMALAFSPGAYSFDTALLVIGITLEFVSPVGSFILLAGLARAVRPAGLPALPSLLPNGEGALSALPRRRIAPYRIALAGAVINLIGGLAGVFVNLARLAFPPTGSFPDYAGYFLTWAIVAFVVGSIVALGSLLAFVGVGLAVRDGWR